MTEREELIAFRKALARLRTGDATPADLHAVRAVIRDATAQAEMAAIERKAEARRDYARWQDGLRRTTAAAAFRSLGRIRG